MVDFAAERAMDPRGKPEDDDGEVEGGDGGVG
jgi:hypothetical protein